MLSDSLSQDTLIAHQKATDLNDVISGVVSYGHETDNTPKAGSFGVCVVVVNTVDPTSTQRPRQRGAEHRSCQDTLFRGVLPRCLTTYGTTAIQCTLYSAVALWLFLTVTSK